MKVAATAFSPPLTAAVGVYAVTVQAPALPEGMTLQAALITMATYFLVAIVREGMGLWAKYRHKGSYDRRTDDNAVSNQINEIHDALLRKDDKTKRAPIDQLIISHAKLFEKLDALVDELRRGREA